MAVQTTGALNAHFQSLVVLHNFVEQNHNIGHTVLKTSHVFDECRVVAIIALHALTVVSSASRKAKNTLHEVRKDGRYLHGFDRVSEAQHADPLTGCYTMLT